MNKTIISSVLFFTIGIGLAALVLSNPFGWSWARAVQARLAMAPDMSETSDPAPLAPISGDDGRDILFWRAPMDANYIRDEPGKSPMGMDLVPVFADEMANAEGIVRIDPGFVQNMGVRSADVQRTDIPHTIRTVGTFTYDDSQVSWINTKFEGWIEDVRVNYVGELVAPGQPLFDIYSPQLVSTQQEYLDAVEYVDRLDGTDYTDVIRRARSLVESARQRLRFWDITDEQIDALVQSGEPRRTLTVVSPVGGRVVSKMEQGLEGMLARPGMNLYQIADLSTIWIEAEVFEDDIPWLRVGQQATIEIPTQPGRLRRGTIRYLYPFLNQETRTLQLSIELPNPGEEIRAEMYANVTFDVPSASGVLTVPEEAVLRTGERNAIVLDLGEGTFQVREVELGANGNGLWEIREGISEGDRVVVSAQFLIDSESNLREAIRKLTTAESAQETSEEPSEEMNGTDMGNMNMDEEVQEP
jgi:RND family efflux transporter MFP subunit